MPAARSARTLLAGLVLAALTTGCRAAAHPDTRAPDSSTFIVSGDELATGAPLLEALQRRVPSMRVVRSTGGCPIIALRGQPGRSAASSAVVYVDDTRMRDTCILLQLQAGDIDRVELHPVAAGSVGGRQGGPGGLILVYRRR